MNKEKVIAWIKSLEDMADQSDKYFVERNELYRENQQLKERINKAIEYYENNQQECIICRNKDDRLIREYYLPAQKSKKILEILKGDNNE